MNSLYEIARAFLILGIGGLVTGMVMIFGAFLLETPWPFVLCVAVFTVVAGIIVDRYVDWM